MNTVISGNEISLFMLVLARVSGLVSSAPLIGEAQVPRMIKAALAIALSFVLVQIPSVAHSTAPTEVLAFSLAVLAQLVLGVMLGYLARIVFFAVETTGGLVSLQMGLSMASVLNPLTRQSSTSLSNLYTIIAGMIFLAVRGDELMVAAVARSFDLAPVTAPLNAAPMMGTVLDAVMQVTQIGVQLGLPIAASLIAANVILGVVSRSMPQLNLFILSMPMNVILGLITILGSMATLILITGNYMQDVPGTMLSIVPVGH